MRCVNLRWESGLLTVTLQGTNASPIKAEKMIFYFYGGEIWGRSQEGNVIICVFFKNVFFTYTPRKFNSKSPRKNSSPVKITSSPVKFRSSQKDMNESSFNQSIFQGQAILIFGPVYQVCSGCAVLSFWSLPLFWCHPSASFPMLMGPSWYLGACEKTWYGMVGWLWGWKSGILVQGSFSQKLRISKTALKIRLNWPPNRKLIIFQPLSYMCIPYTKRYIDLVDTLFFFHYKVQLKERIKHHHGKTGNESSIFCPS